METTGNKKVYVIGDKESLDVWGLFGDIESAGYEPVMVEPSNLEEAATAVYCATGNDCRLRETLLFAAIGNNVRILPVLFQGGRIPAILADVASADMRTDKRKGWLRLIEGIRRFA